MRPFQGLNQLLIFPGALPPAIEFQALSVMSLPLSAKLTASVLYGLTLSPSTG
jgi:hypothetical protein